MSNREICPKISIIVPCYNVEKYVERCLTYLVNQSYKNLEIICVNDGSTDSTLEILKMFSKKDERINVITQINGGLSNARNTGINNCTGEYISFVDSDDWIDENYIEKLYDAIARNNCDIAVATIVRKREKSQKYRVHYKKEKVYTELQEKLDICGIPKCCYVWNKLYKADLVKIHLFKEKVYFEDVLWTPQVLKDSDKIVTVPDANYYYYVNSNSIVKTNNPKKQWDSYFAKKMLIQFFQKNNIEFPDKYKSLTKEIRYVGKIQLLKIKEIETKLYYYLLGFIKIPSFVVNIFIYLKILCKKIFSISEFDEHKVIYLCGFQIRSRIKNVQPIQNEINSYGLNTKPREVKIIASLTTFPERINTVKETIKTLLKQTCKPDELILWLATEQFPNGESSLPQELLELKEYGLSIKWCNDIKSYKKLVPALKEYPNDIIITFDDDIYYDNNVIELLYNSYLIYPNCVHTNRAVRLKVCGCKLSILSNAIYYWHKYNDNSCKNTIIGCGGVLYPPNSLNSEVLNEKQFTKLIPTQDDIWFWAMATLNKTPIKVVASYDMNIRTVKNTQQYGLSKINNSSKKGVNGKDGFRIIAEEYPELITILKGEENA